MPKARLVRGDVLEVLRRIPDKYVEIALARLAHWVPGCL
jgi:hypothetical protein